MLSFRFASAVAVVALLVALLTIGSAPADAAVMGIDFGSEFIKVASVKPGTPFHIVVDEQSKRKIPAVVAFDQGERHFGNGALQLAMRKPKETYMWAHTLLGKDINSPQVATLRAQGFPWEIVELPERRSLGFRHSVSKVEGQADVVFSVEEIVAMSLQHMMKIAEADAESPVKDCVLTVPQYWTHRERQAMLDAAEIAGLNVLSLMNENTAAAVQYGIDRKYSANETHTIMLYNMGSTSTKVSVARFSAFVRKERNGKSNRTVGQVEMLASGFDDTLGGHAFEARIVDWIVAQVTTQLRTKPKHASYDVRTNVKAMAKIRAAAEKAKIVLSANQESLVFLNSLHDDMDFKMMLTRAEFYEMSADLLARVAQPMATALADSNLAIGDIDAVVIIGGSVRIPAVQASIKTFAQREQLAQNLNGDEAMVMGAVFRAANLSTTFQVRPFGMIDSSPYAVGVRISDKGTENAEGAAAAAETEVEAAAEGAEGTAATAAFSKRASLFKRYNRLMKKKTVQFSHTNDFSAQLSHESSQAHPLPAGIPLPIDLYSVSGVQRLLNNSRYAELLKEQKPRIALSFLLDSSGVSSLVRAEATLDENVRVPKPKAKAAADSDAANATAEDKKGDAEAEADKKKDETAAADATETDAEGEFTIKKKTHTIPLQVSKVGSPGSLDAMNATQKVLAKATLEKLRRADDLKKEIAAAKNTLEAHIYATRSSIGEHGVDAVSSDEQRETVREALAVAEEWLYEQGDDSAKVFHDKLAELRALSDPIFFRLAEASALPAALNTTTSLLAFVAKQVAEYETSRPWVPAAERTRLGELATDLSEWLADQQAEQSKLGPYDTPVLESEQLYERLRPIHKLSNDLMKLKKPVEKPKPKPSAKKGKGKKKAATADADADAAATPAEDKEKAEAANAAADDKEVPAKETDTTGAADAAAADATAEQTETTTATNADAKKDEL